MVTRSTIGNLKPNALNITITLILLELSCYVEVKTILEWEEAMAKEL